MVLLLRYYTKPKGRARKISANLEEGPPNTVVKFGTYILLFFSQKSISDLPLVWHYNGVCTIFYFYVDGGSTYIREQNWSLRKNNLQDLGKLLQEGFSLS